MNKKRELVRLLSVTSVHQVYIGLACMVKNEDRKTKYNDYLIINNTMILDKTAESIRTVAKCHNFVNIIDMRNDLEWYKDLKLHYEKSRIGLKKQLIGFFNLISRGKKVGLLMNRLKMSIPYNKIDEIYSRYKFNFPEQLLFSTFNNAGIHVFEDGLGDYINNIDDNTKTKDENKKQISIKSLINSLSKIIILRKFKKIDKYYSRIKGMYSLIDVHDGDRKFIFKERVNLQFVNIKNSYLEILNISRNKLLCNEYNKPFVLLLPTLFSARKLWYRDIIQFGIEDDINYTFDIIQTIKRQYPNCDIIIKTHPRTPEWLIEAFNNEFDNHYCHVDSRGDIPSEILCNNNNLKAIIAGFISSTLLYSKEIFGKKSYFARPFPDKIKGLHRPNEVKSYEDTLKRFGVEELYLN